MVGGLLVEHRDQGTVQSSQQEVGGEVGIGRPKLSRLHSLQKFREANQEVTVPMARIAVLRMPIG